MRYAHANRTYYVQTYPKFLTACVLPERHCPARRMPIVPPSRDCRFSHFCKVFSFIVFSCVQMCFHCIRSSTCGTHCCWATLLSPSALAWPYCSSSGTVSWLTASTSASCSSPTCQVRAWPCVQISLTLMVMFLLCSSHFLIHSHLPILFSYSNDFVVLQCGNKSAYVSVNYIEIL